MSFIPLIINAFFFLSTPNFIVIPKVNSDSIENIRYSLDGYTSRSTRAIIVDKKNGDTVLVLYSQHASLRPGTLSVSKNKKWFTIANPNWSNKKKNCSPLLCSLNFGICKCDQVVSDSVSADYELSEGPEGGFTYFTDNPKYSKNSGKDEPKFIAVKVSEEEMTKRFLEDYNKIPKL